jgi:hypothetical protein
MAGEGGIGTTLRRAPLLLLAAALVAFALFAAPAGAAKLKRGYYDCYGTDFVTGGMMYTGSIKLEGKSRYEHSFGREGRKMVDKTTGKYRVKGKRISFTKGGAMKGTKGKVVKRRGAAPVIDLLLKGEPSGITCYPIKNKDL